jgi:glycosyltransferase involved in cell wall biosynthesis
MTSTTVQRPPICAIVTTFNEEEHIRDCIESLLWCDEILVVDSFSTDQTPEIARGFDRVRFLQRTYYGSASQKNWAIDQARSGWILILDADERCTPELRQEIEELLASGPEQDAYTIRRRVYFLGKIIRFSGWRHDRVVRLLAKGAGRYPNRRVHADMVTRSQAPQLRNPMIHYMVEDFVTYVRRIEKYCYWGAAQLWKENRKSGAAEVLGRSAWRFVRTYLLQLGILDGMRGLIFCLLQAYSTWLKWSILWAWRTQAAAGREPELPNFDEDERTWRGLEELVAGHQPPPNERTGTRPG